MTTIIVLFTVDFVHGLANKSFVNSEHTSLDVPALYFEANDPESSDSELKRYYHVEVPSVPTAEKLVGILSTLPEVEACWVKPDEQIPD